LSSSLPHALALSASRPTRNSLTGVNSSFSPFESDSDSHVLSSPLPHVAPSPTAPYPTPVSGPSTSPIPFPSGPRLLPRPVFVTCPHCSEAYAISSPHARTCKKQRQLFVCDDTRNCSCGKTFTEARNLERHLRPRLARCRWCRKKMIEANLNRHLTTCKVRLVHDGLSSPT